MPTRATLTRTEFLPEFGRPVKIAEFDRPRSGADESETAQTIAYMDEIAAADAGEFSIISATHGVLEDNGLDLHSSPLDIACAIFRFLKDTIRYVPTPGTSPLVDQTLITPAAILAMPEPIGDCPQFSMLAAAMFRVCCIPCYFVTIAADEADPSQYSHVYNTVEIAPAVFLPFDSSNGPEPGAEYARAFKRRVWDRITPDKCSARKATAHPMLRTNRSTPRAGMRNSQLRGALGITGPEQTVIDMMGGGYDTSPVNTSGGSNGGFWNHLLDVGAQIAVPIIRSRTQQQPYFIANPSGQSVLFNPNTGAVAGSATTLGSAVNPTYLLLGGLGLAAVLLLNRK